MARTVAIEQAEQAPDSGKLVVAKTMKAAVMHGFGDVDVLKYEDVPIPQVRPGHVLIKVLAAGLNRFDHYIREGSVVPELPFPHILGADAVGEVAELGRGVTGLQVGDRVIPASAFPTNPEEYDVTPMALAPSWKLMGLHRPGTYAQYIEVPARFAVKDNTDLTAEELATLPMVVFTTVRAARVVGEVKAGDRVLVTAGASGTGSMAIQVARALGAEVATTIRDDNKAEFVKSIGADLVINSQRENLVERVMEWTGGRGADVVLDNVGGAPFAQSIDAVKAQGIVVAYGFMAGTEVTFNIRNFFFGQKQIRGTGFGDMQDFEWGLEQLRAGRIKPLLDRALPLSRAAEGHRLVSNSQVFGNIVLLPWAE